MITPSNLDAEEGADGRLELLLELLLDDALTEAETGELNGLLADDPEAQQLLLETQQMHADLLGLFTTLEASSPEPASAE